MNSPRQIKILLLVMLFCCHNFPSFEIEASAAERISFIDTLNKTVTLTIPAQRIVVLNSDAAEILCSLKATDRIVGISGHIAKNSTGMLDELKNKPIVGSPQEPNLEKIIELEADLVISYEMWVAESAFEHKLVPMGIPVARIACYRLDEMVKDIRLLGRISGREERAEAYAMAFQQPLDAIRERLKSMDKPIRVYAEGYGDYGTVSRGIGGAMLLEHAGVVNIAAELPFPYPKVTAEWVIEQNPDVIIKAAGSTFVKTGYDVVDIAPVEKFHERLMNRPGWHQIDAVKNNRVHLISAEIWTGPRAPVGILYIAKWCYPDLFRDMDPRAFHRQWLRKWYDKDFQGIFVYPE